MKNEIITIGLVGNPNCGKTTIFNALTGARHKVANWSGVTVEKLEGRIKHRGITIKVIDLPGIYSLSSYSMEEIITRNFIVNDHPDVIINVVDAGNLERNLYLTTQLINIGARIILSLNMSDEAASKGISIDQEKLGTLLGMPVIKTVGTKSIGITELLDSVINITAKTDSRSRHIHIPFGQDVEAEIKKIQSAIRTNELIGKKYSTRWLAVRLLEKDADIYEKIKNYPNYENITKQVLKSRDILEKKFNDDIETVISDGPYGFISGALHEATKKTPLKRVDISEQIDKVLTNRLLGFPILFLFLYLLFHLTYILGESPLKLIQSGVVQLGILSENLFPPGPLKDMVVDGIIGGVGGVIIFIPNILLLFMGISFMEDTGYMARAAFIMDKVMHSLGLHGKSFIPLIMGFGCNVPAIMASRSLENRQDRILTILINPFMSCSARLPVYLLFAGIFFKEHAGTIVLSLYMIGIGFAFISARIYKLLFFKKESAPFVMELPPYRIPALKTTLLHVWDRASQYLRKMGGIILAFSIIIWAMGSYPKSPDIEKQYKDKISSVESEFHSRIKSICNGRGISKKTYDSLETEFNIKKEKILFEKAAREKENTAIGRLGKAIYPVIKPLGFSWQMGVSLITGFVTKEIVVSTMGVIYQASPSEDPHYTQRPLQETLKKPQYGITPLVAYTFMLFVLLYVPCLATVVVIGKEISWNWAAFSIFYQLGLAWLVSFLFYNAGRFLGF